MADDEQFEPRLGRMRHQGGKRARSYLSRVLAATNLARGRAVATLGRKGFNGSRIGRGAGIGRMLSRRGGAGAWTARRVIIKSSIVRLAGKGSAAAAAHLRYLQRDGTTREGEPGALYGPQLDVVDGKEFRERGAGDRHQFRFIVSPEDGAEYEDLKPLTRNLMTRVEEDLGTKLDWVAVDHFNTGHPHTHIIVRGKDHLGHDLVIAPDYLTKGMRERASELVDLDLGPRSVEEVAHTLRAEIGQERLTSIDRSLLRDRGKDNIVAAQGSSSLDQSLRAGRLTKLEQLGLAEPLTAGCWRLEERLEETLKAMGERGDIIRTMQRELTARKLERPWVGRSVFGAGNPDSEPIIGRVIARGFADEDEDRHFLLVDGVDGHAHYVDVGRGDSVAPIPEGAIVRVSARSLSVRDADRVVAEVAAANSGRYSVDLHLRHDPTATQAFAETHVRRLEAMRRAGVGVEREADGSWSIAADHPDRAAAYEVRRHRDHPVEIETLSAVPLEQLRRTDASTWLDRELANGAPTRTATESGSGPMRLRSCNAGNCCAWRNSYRVNWARPLWTRGLARRSRENCRAASIWPAGALLWWRRAANSR